MTQGSDLMVFMDGKSIANAQSHTLNTSVNMEETSTKDVGDGGWGASEPGKGSFTMSTDNLIGTAAESKGATLQNVMDAYLQKKKVHTIFALKAEENIGTDGWTPDMDGWYEGDAYISSLTITAQDGQKATYTAEFTGVGALTKTTAG